MSAGITYWVKLIVSIAVPLVVGGIGGIATQPQWYQTLERPPWAPPPWLFGPVWTTLYILMGIALFLVWRRGWNRRDVRFAMMLFGIQLFFNLLWSVIFFTLRSPTLALIELIMLWLLILWTLTRFWRIDSVAGVLLIPYLAWVTFAGILNASLAYLN